jgi:hypothetical protein
VTPLIEHSKNQQPEGNVAMLQQQVKASENFPQKSIEKQRPNVARLLAYW